MRTQNEEIINSFILTPLPPPREVRAARSYLSNVATFDTLRPHICGILIKWHICDTPYFPKTTLARLVETKGWNNFCKRLACPPVARAWRVVFFNFETGQLRGPIEPRLTRLNCILQDLFRDNPLHYIRHAQILYLDAFESVFERAKRQIGESLKRSWKMQFKHNDLDLVSIGHPNWTPKYDQISFLPDFPIVINTVQCEFQKKCFCKTP